MKNIRSIFLISIFAAIYTISSAQTMSSKMLKSVAVTPVNKAVCVVYPTQGNAVTGTIIFTRVDGGVRVVADLKGLSKGKHGIHIHECGDCSAADGTSAAGHFNPMGETHGAPMDAMRHEGDMGNIEADDSGNAHLDYIDKSMSLDGSTTIIGRSVIVHEKEDDLKSQPTGNAGARIACGVIGIGK